MLTQPVGRTYPVLSRPNGPSRRPIASGADAEEFVKVNNPAFSWHGFDSAPASSRAEAVLRLAGCPATRDEAFQWYKRMAPRSAGNNEVA